MSDARYLKDRISLYLLFFGVVLVISLVILLLPYETVYVQDETYLDVFLVVIVACVFVFFLGTLFNVLLWMSGKGLVGTPEGRLLRLLPRTLRFIFSRRFWRILAVFLKDAFYLSKLKGRSFTRWSMHLLILGGFAAMFMLDLLVTFSLDFLKYQPMIEDGGWAKLWIRDFGFEIVGLMMLAGLTIAAVRRFILKPKMVRTELPDATSILVLLAVVLGGFILEGIGIAGRIPGHQVDQVYSFVGYAFAQLMPDSAGQYYNQAWLVHGVMSALLIAYIPFSKLFHMIATPIAIEADKMLPSGVRTS
ncbi:MAG: respiratory nitrate reductase subunit gamma [Thermoplasmata archaeon]